MPLVNLAGSRSSVNPSPAQCAFSESDLTRTGFTGWVPILSGPDYSMIPALPVALLLSRLFPLVSCLDSYLQNYPQNYPQNYRASWTRASSLLDD